MGVAVRTALVLGGGGILGSAQVGMLASLMERDIRPDVVVGASIGAVNGAMIAADPSPASVQRLRELWTSSSDASVFAGSVVAQAARVARHRTHLQSSEPLRQLIEKRLPVARIEDLPVQFECVAASIEKAAAHWFAEGSVADALVASCAVPGLFPAARVGEEHFFDGGLVHSIPVGRAVELGAQRIYVLHVGRIEQPLSPPRWPWEVALVAFEIARRHRFVEEMSRLPAGVEVHVLPTGGGTAPSVNIRYRNTARVMSRIDIAHQASTRYLDDLEAVDD
ncbi:MAG: patatin-like phospholipase family protein [Actinomycetota bacterium]|nr:patatin-like phospholipase family protein [Actinomycetota bacterium]